MFFFLSIITSLVGLKPSHKRHSLFPLKCGRMSEEECGRGDFRSVSDAMLDSKIFAEYHLDVFNVVVE